MKREKQNKKENNKLISIIEMILFISLTFSIPSLYSYNENKGNININFFEKIISLIDIFPSVNAQILDNVGGDILQQIEGGIEGLTTGQTGCCFDDNEGLCSPNSQKTECEAEDDGKFYRDVSCNINQCILGCCLIGTESQFVTQTRCNKLREISGLPTSFNSGVRDELACIGLADSQDVGACVILSTDEYEKNYCKFTNKDDCNILSGEFHKDLLCSNPDLNTVCEKQKSASCIEGKDGLYWLDSCGNRENIYDTNKERSWNSGKVLGEKESCSPISSNSRSSSCGNCAYDQGSICGAYRPGIDKGNMQGFTCRDLNCKEGLRTRKNGESWCLYDGQVGNGRDVVGSRHFRRLCINGELKTEPCADYRKEICVKEGGIGDIVKDTTNEILGQFGVSIPDMSNIPGLSGLLGGSGSGGIGEGLRGLTGFVVNNETGNENNNGGGILDNLGGGEIINKLTTSSVICRPNMWEDCSGRNILTCSKNPDCKTKIVYVDEDFYLLKCVPKYPPGSDLSSSKGIKGSISSISGTLTSIISSDMGGLGSLGGGLGGGGDVCSAATQTCTVIYVKECSVGGLGGLKWKCKENCNCEEMGFTAQMNDYCTMLGDCGAKSNIAGKVDSGGYFIIKKGGKAKKPPKLIGIDQIYSIFSKGGKLGGITGGVDGGFYNQVPKFDMISGQGINLFGAATGLSGDIDPGDGGSQWSNIMDQDGWLSLGTAYLMGCGKTKKTKITFTCKAWSPPAIGICEFCNKDPAKPCSKYRCESLGKNCRLINENTGQDECITINLEIGIPLITPYEKVLNDTLYQYSDIGLNGFNIRTKEGECIQAFTPLVFGVKTNIPSICRIGEEATSFEEMGGGFLEGEIYTENHTTTTYLPSVESLIAGETGNSSDFSEVASNQTIYNYLLGVVGDLNLYVKCQSAGGQENIGNYKINFCVKPGPDLTPPIFLASSPANGASVGYNTPTKNVGIFVNEPVECNWGTTRPTATNLLESYNSLNNKMSCETEADGGTLLGYPCNATLPLTQIENKFYIQCRDQPWLEENTSRNIGEILEYTLKRTDTPLVIESIIPNGTIYRGAEPTSVEIIVQTVGGLNSGESICKYYLNENNNYITFSNTNSNVHTQILNLVKGTYKVKVKCVDAAGNIANSNSEFTLELDTKFPEVTRVFYSSGSLVVITDESSRCYYRNDSTPQCNYNYENATEMIGGDAFIHQASWDKETTYYIKCKDVWGNSAGSCSIVAKPFEIINY